MPMIRNIVAAAFALAATATAIPAEDLMPVFAAAREYHKNLAKDACLGSAESNKKLLTASNLDKDPTAMVSRAWLIVTPSCSFSTGDQEEAFFLNSQAGQMGYPVAISNTGFRLIQGLGTTQNTEAGVKLAKLAIKSGFSPAAVYLSRYYAKGEYLKRDLNEAKLLLNMAEALNVDADLLADGWATYNKHAGN